MVEKISFSNEMHQFFIGGGVALHIRSFNEHTNCTKSVMTSNTKPLIISQVYEPNIIYSHGAGEYLGLVSAESAANDLSPPASVYVKEDATFLKIDRDHFHDLLEDKRKALMNEKWDFINTGWMPFTKTNTSESNNYVFLLILYTMWSAIT